MKVAIVGFATEGEVSAKYWAGLGHEITICDQDTALTVPDGFNSKLGQNYLDNLGQFDVIVRTAGIHPRLIIEKNPDVAPKITTGIEEFMRVCPTKNIIGVTGTKGKGTTTTLISKMLAASGLAAHIGGNIGIPPLELLPKIKADDWVVLELSSFQLEDFKGPSPHIAVCIMVVPEHLNWHANMEEYLVSKSRLFEYQAPEDMAIYYAGDDNSTRIAAAGPGIKIPYMKTPGAVINEDAVEIGGQKICPISKIKLPGKHNWQNICAAVTAVWQITQDIEAVGSVLSSFSGLEHRIELVRELDGVKYYDDSFATTPETAIAAIQAFDNPKVLILGGSDKGIPLDSIADEVIKNNIRHIVLIGNTTHPEHTSASPEIESALHIKGINNITSLVKPGGTTMAEIVQTARQQAQPGDVVLLSTGCASFDMFKDYKDRGNQFKQVVKSLN